MQSLCGPNLAVQYFCQCANVVFSLHTSVILCDYFYRWIYVAVSTKYDCTRQIRRNRKCGRIRPKKQIKTNTNGS